MRKLRVGIIFDTHKTEAFKEDITGLKLEFETRTINELSVMFIECGAERIPDIAEVCRRNKIKFSEP